MGQERTLEPRAWRISMGYGGNPASSQLTCVHVHVCSQEHILPHVCMCAADLSYCAVTPR